MALWGVLRRREADKPAAAAEVEPPKDLDAATRARILPRKGAEAQDDPMNTKRLPHTWDYDLDEQQCRQLFDGKLIRGAGGGSP